MGETIIERLYIAMKTKKMTAVSITAQLGISKSLITDWKLGRARPPVDHLIKIAKMLDISLIWLLTGEGSMNQLNLVNLDEKHSALIKRIKSLGDADQEQISEFIYAMVEYKKRRLNEASRNLTNSNEMGVSDNSSRNICENCENQKLRKIKIYELAASAGFGNYLDDESPYTIFEFGENMIPRVANFGIRISGDSMEPRITDGSTVWVREQIQVDNGAIGIFILNNEAYCKKLEIDYGNKEVRLVSLNEDYKPITVLEDDYLKTVGQVVFL